MKPDKPLKLILDVELNSGKHLKLYETSIDEFLKWPKKNIFKRIKRQPKTRYFAFWGNSDSISDMGMTEILTPKGNLPTIKGAIRQFHKMIKATEKVNFLK